MVPGRLWRAQTQVIDVNLVINANVTPSSATGVGRYIEGLASALVQADPALRLSFLVDQKQPELLSLPNCPRTGLPFRPDHSFRHIPYQPYVMWTLKKLNTDVYHVANTSPLLFTSLPTVITIHDLQEFFIDKYGAARNTYRKALNALSARVADAVVTASEHSKWAIVERLGVREEKVHSIPHGRDERFEKVDDGEGPVAPPYIISVGQLQPGKNYTRLLDAFSRAGLDGVRLIIVGSRGWDYDRLFERARRPDLERRVVFLEGVSTEQLITLYSHASLCVLPSLYEGFGMPALEAMGCDVPVIAANNSSLPEVLGPAGRYFDPHSVDEMAWVMERVLGDSSLQDEMRERGRARVKGFTWERAARATLQVYESIL